MPWRPPPRPADLEPWEEEVASWLGLLEEVAPPADLRDRVLAAARARPRPVPRWAALASLAALLLLGLGLGRLSLDARRVAQSAGPPDGPPSGLREARVVDDPGIPLFGDLDTFAALDSWSEVGIGEEPR